MFPFWLDVDPFLALSGVASLFTMVVVFVGGPAAAR